LAFDRKQIGKQLKTAYGLNRQVLSHFAKYSSDTLNAAVEEFALAPRQAVAGSLEWSRGAQTVSGRLERLQNAPDGAAAGAATSVTLTYAVRFGARTGAAPRPAPARAAPAGPAAPPTRARTAGIDLTTLPPGLPQ